MDTFFIVEKRDFDRGAISVKGRAILDAYYMCISEREFKTSHPKVHLPPYLAG